jgi:hypothetical protein
VLDGVGRRYGDRPHGGNGKKKRESFRHDAIPPPMMLVVAAI